MSTVQIALSFPFEGHTAWGADWVWGCPLVVLTVIIHVLGLGYISQRAILIHGDIVKHRHSTATFAVVVGATALLATVLHGIEAALWGIAYLVIGAMPNVKTAMLYSLGAMTTYG